MTEPIWIVSLMLRKDDFSGAVMRHAVYRSTFASKDEAIVETINKSLKDYPGFALCEYAVDGPFQDYQEAHND